MKKNFFKDYNIKWVFKISIITFFLAIIFNFITDLLVVNLNLFMSFILLIFIILIGVIFDIIGVAVTSAKKEPFHSMAANRVVEAKYAIELLKNASQVSNFCNDVIGDISGIISGALGATILYKIVAIYKLGSLTLMSVLLTSFIAALTVGGKALGKEYAIKNAEDIIYRTAKIIHVFKK